MNRLNIIFSLSSLSVLLVTAERFSPTTKVLLQPYNFLRLHELVQMTILILATVILPFLLLRIVTHNFQTIQSKTGFSLFTLFIIGVYFYATGNGLHEVSSFNFNQFCDVYKFSGDLCWGFFINDYYTGNIFYFVGGALMVASILLLEKMSPSTDFPRKGLWLLTANAIIYALAIFAYAAFDRVLVGLVYSVAVTLFSIVLFFPIRKNFLKYPVITYTTITYTLGTLLALIVRNLQT